MAENERDIVAHESYLARRIVRLFRIERVGRLSRRSHELMQRLLDRRGELIDALVRIDAARRQLRLPVSLELQQAAERLWQESGDARRAADARLDQLHTDLLIARGHGIPSGIRGSATGRILGRG